MNMLPRILGACGAMLSGLSAQTWLELPRVTVDDPFSDVRAIGDVDGDGATDLIAVEASFALSYIAAFAPQLSRGVDSFVAGTRVPVTPLTNAFEADSFFLAGDVTGDGRADVVSSLRGYDPVPGHGFYVYRGLGGGAFAPPVFTSLRGVPLHGALSDWDRNGVFELVETHLHTSLTFGVQRWTWNGGGFTASNEIVSTDALRHVAIGDITGDGRDDAVVGDWFLDGVFVMPTLTNGNLGAQTVYRVGLANPNGQGRTPSCGDIDRDGDIDVVVGWKDVFQTLPTHFAVLRNAGGVLSVGATQSFAIDPGFYFDGTHALVDWDRDGDLDVACSWSRLVLFENRGSTGLVFVASMPIADGLSTRSGSDEGGLAVGVRDFDDNGFPDYVAGRVIKYGLGTFDDSYGVGLATAVAQVCDIDGDGDVDLPNASAEISVNDGNGTLRPIGNILPPVTSPLFYTGADAFGDFNGDGYGDFISPLSRFNGIFSNTFLGSRLIAGSVSGEFLDRGFAGPSGVRLGDFFNTAFVQRDLDGDADIDLAQVDGWWDNDGSGVFGTLHAAWTGRPVASGDVDGDGDPDVVTRTSASGSSATAMWLQRNNAGSFTAEVLATENDPLGDLSLRPLLTDLDADGDLDFAVGTAAGGPAVLVRENVNGMFAAEQRLPAVDLAWQLVAADDVNRDGRVDLIGMPSDEQTGIPSKVLVWRHGAAALVFDPPRAYFGEPCSQLADVDSDGDLDAVARFAKVRGAARSGPSNGLIRQYGNGVPGPSGVVPLLGVRGPVRVGSLAQLRFRRGQGGGAAAFVVGAERAAIPNSPLPGLTLRSSPVLAVLPLVLSGPAGVAGAGFLDVNYPIQPALFGVRPFHQAFFLDGSGVSGSNGLEILYGR